MGYRAGHGCSSSAEGEADQRTETTERAGESIFERLHIDGGTAGTPGAFHQLHCLSVPYYELYGPQCENLRGFLINI